MELRPTFVQNSYRRWVDKLNILDHLRLGRIMDKNSLNNLVKRMSRSNILTGSKSEIFETS